MKTNIDDSRSHPSTDTHRDGWLPYPVDSKSAYLLPFFIRNFSSLRPWPTKLKGEMGRRLLGVRFFGRCLSAAGWLAAGCEAYAAGDMDPTVVARGGDTAYKLDE